MFFITHIFPAKTKKGYFTSILLPFLICLFILSCKKDDESPSAKNSCRVQNYTSGSSGPYTGTVNYTSNYSINYTYDDRGNNTGQNSTSNYQYSDGKASTSSSSISYQYSDDGFRVKMVSQYNSKDRDGATRVTSDDVDYTYEKGRLVKESHNYTDDGKDRDYQNTYEYDNDGRLIKFASTYTNSSSKYEYTKGRLSKITNVDTYGNAYSPLFELNSDGKLTKIIRETSPYQDEERYKYDAQGNIIRNERWIDSKPYFASEYTWDTKLNTDILLFVLPKGHPKYPTDIWTYKNNYSKISYYKGDTTGNWELTNYTNYTNDYNAQNYLTESTSKSFSKDGTQTSISRTAYTLENCK